jgi:hypothetical protein
MTPEEFLRAPTNTYSDWFGEGDGHSDYRKTVGEGSPRSRC